MVFKCELIPVDVLSSTRVSPIITKDQLFCAEAEFATATTISVIAAISFIVVFIGAHRIASLGQDANKELRRGERLGTAESDLHSLEVVGGGGDGLGRRGIIGPGAQMG